MPADSYYYWFIEIKNGNIPVEYLQFETRNKCEEQIEKWKKVQHYTQMNIEIKKVPKPPKKYRGAY